MSLSDTIYLLPEIILGLTAALVFLLDVVWLRRAPFDSSGNYPQARFLPYVALAGLAVALAGLIPSVGSSQRVAALLVVDPFSVFFEAFVILAIALVILTAVS